MIPGSCKIACYAEDIAWISDPSTVVKRILD